METITKEAPKGIEIETPAAPAAAAPAPTDAELTEQGWGPEEIAAAKKRGIIKGDKPAPAAEKPAKEAAAPADAAAAKPEEGKEPASAEKPAEEPAAGKPKSGGIPEFNLSETQEKELEKILPEGHPVRGIYFRMKSERQARQKLAAELAALKEQLAARPAAAALPEGPEGGAGDEELDRPVTGRMLQELERQKAAAAAKQREEHQQRAAVVTSAQKDQEEYARSIYVDFDDTLKKAGEVISNLDALVPEKHRRARVLRLIHDLQVAAANADKFELEDDHGAMLAYELGKFHPEYGRTHGDKPKETGLPKDPKAPGGLTPATLERIEKQTQRKGSSAAVPAGGGRRVIAPEEVTEADFAGMDYKKRAAFKEQYPEQYARLMRG